MVWEEGNFNINYSIHYTCIIYMLRKKIDIEGVNALWIIPSRIPLDLLVMYIIRILYVYIIVADNSIQCTIRVTFLVMYRS